MSNVVQPARAYSSIMRTLGDIDRRDSDARIPCVDGNSSSRAASAAEETVIRRDGCNSNDSGGSDSAASTPPRTTSPPALPSNTTQTDIEMLQAENALLRLELAEAQEKLRVATTNVSGLSVRPIRSRSPSGEVVRSRSDKDAGNRGVACVQMRRLLLKDDRFLREEFLPFLNMDDFGRLSGVCRRLKRSTYDLDMIFRCVETGGITDFNRGLMWLIMVGMDTVEPAARGILGVVIRERAESPEEQYDRLHRAMNGTINTASPVVRSRQESSSTPPATAADDVKGGGETAAAAVPSADGGGAGEAAERSRHGEVNGGGQKSRRVSEITVGDAESDRSAHSSNNNNDNNNNNNNDNSRDSRSRGGSDSSTGGGAGGRGSTVSLGGDASVGGESVLLWEDSDSGSKGVAGTTTSTSPRVQLRLEATADASASSTAETDEQATAKSAAAAAAEAAEVAAMAEAAAETAGAAFDAEAAAGIRPLGGRQSEAVTAAVTEEAAEAIEAAEKAAKTAAGLAEAAADAEDASAPAAAGAGAGAGEAEGGLAGSSHPPQRPPPVAAPATGGVVGWASGLFRRSPGVESPKSATGSSVPSSLAGGLLSPSITRTSSAPFQGQQRTSTSSTGSRMGSAGRLFGGLRYPRGSSPAPSALSVNNPSPSDAASETVFDKILPGKEKGATPPPGAANASVDGGAFASEDKDGEPPFERVPGLYAALLVSADAMDANDMTGVRGPKQSCFVDIEKDLQRTLGMTDVAPLRNVLRCTSTFVPDVGYVQGMNFVCRSLLQVYPKEEEAFWVFVGMLQRFGMRKLYCPGMPLLRLRFFQLNRLLMWHLPDLHEHFEACGVQTNLFATSWFVTLLSDGGMLPDMEVKVVWDCIFLHSSSPASQWSPVFLFLLEMLRRASTALKGESRFSELIQRLVNMPFRDLCQGSGANSTIREARRRFETSSPMPVQLLLLHDQWMEGGGEDGDSSESNGDKQLL
ncbi:unnamed protein product [Pylaiella littoralis]